MIGSQLISKISVMRIKLKLYDNNFNDYFFFNFIAIYYLFDIFFYWIHKRLRLRKLLDGLKQC